MSVCSLFLVQILLARILSKQDYGVYSHIMSIATVSCLFLVWGSDKIAVKDVSINFEKKLHANINNDCFNMYLIVFFNIILIFPVVTFFLWYSHTDLFNFYFVCLFLALLIFFAIARISSSVTKGLHFVILSESIINFIRPLALMTGLWVYWRFSTDFGLIQALIVSCFSYVLSIILTSSINFSKIKRDYSYLKFQPLVTYKDSFPFFIIGVGIPLLSNIDILLLGAQTDTSQVALYVASSKIINLVLMGLVSANLLISPKLSSLYSQQKLTEMLSLVRTNNFFVSVLTVILILILLFFGKFVLLLFGKEYVDSYPILLTLLCGQIVNVFCGPVNLICQMADQQRSACFVIITACLIELIFCLLLIPFFGAIGAAMSNVLSLSFMNICLVYVVKKRIGIDPTVMNVFKKETQSLMP